jgi:tRNA dimethylallyltransferase
VADGPRSAIAVCGPTAAGKSGLTDDLADAASDRLGSRVPTIVVDSVQVYAGLAGISNQARRRPAELVGVVPLTERWTVARHRRAADRITAASGPAFVLDAGTGMYLNALLLDIPLAPRVPEDVRARAERESAADPNPRRSSRQRELEMVDARERGSIWDGDLRHRTYLLYVRPQRPELDRAIALRSMRIVREGLGEASAIRDLLRAGEDVNPSVLEAVGVRELLDHLSGRLSLPEAEDRISARTRQLARRQIRWFDKLARTLEGRAAVSVAEDPKDKVFLHRMHDTMGA